MSYKALHTEIKSKEALLVAVSKTKPKEKILELYEQGHRAFGENKVQELVEKYNSLPKDIEWHFIGHLQRNKVKYLAPFVHLIHGVDSLRLLSEINKQGLKNDRTIDCLLQFHIAEEQSKFGLSFTEAIEIMESAELKAMHNIRILGVMGMATYTEDYTQIKREFSQLRSIFNQLKENYFPASDSFKEISMGMSGDYQVALEEGSTMLRIGSLIFGQRK